MERSGDTVKKLGRKPKDAKEPFNTRIRVTTKRMLERFVGQGRIQCEVVDQALAEYMAKRGKA